MKKLSIALFLVVLLVGCVPSPGPLSVPVGKALTVSSAFLPNAKLTPGDVLPVTVKDICVVGYTKKFRNVTDAVKAKVYAEYGLTNHAPGAYEIDHLISLELGGSNSIKNLWPESYTGAMNAHIKDGLENKMHALVCSGSLNLGTAQRAIASNWVTAYRLYGGQ